MPPELNIPTQPRRFDPSGQPRTWLLDDEQPPMWPEALPLAGSRLRSMHRCGVIYRFYGKDEQLLYVGQVASDPVGRWRMHRTSSAWWDLSAFLSIAHVTPIRDDRLALERAAIRSERPLYNKQHNPVVHRAGIRLDTGMRAVLEQLRTTLTVDDFAALVAAFKAEPDGAS